MELATPNVFSNSVQDDVQEHIRMFQQLRSNRGIWEVHWQEIAELVQPMDSQTFQNQWPNQGQKKTEKLYDSTANIALSRFVAILDSLLTPHNQTWHRLITDDDTLNKSKAVQNYYDEVTRILFRERYKQSANFIEQNQMSYLHLGAYGTGAMFTDDLWGTPGLRYKNIHLGELYFAENHQGIPDKVYRWYRLTARQAVQKWPKTAPEIIQSMAKTQPETLYEFVHVCVPRVNFDPQRKDYKGMPWMSMDISLLANAKLGEGGYRTFPYSITRYSRGLQEVYGRSPAMDVLPTIKTLNEEKKSLLKQAHRVLDPMYLVHDDGVLNTMNAIPGTVIPGGVSPDGRPLVHALQTGNTQIGQEIMQDDRNDIKDAFLSSFFQYLVETPEMTATEVMERVKEKGVLIAPTIGRQEHYLSNVVNREIDILARQGLLPPMPSLLRSAGGQFKIRFESPLAKMRRAEEASGLMRMLQTSIEVVQATTDPSLLFFFNWDTIMPDMAEINGLPSKWVNTLDKVNQLRQSQADQKATENAIQAGPAAAAVLKATNGK